MIFPPEMLFLFQMLIFLPKMIFPPEMLFLFQMLIFSQLLLLPQLLLHFPLILLFCPLSSPLLQQGPSPPGRAFSRLVLYSLLGGSTSLPTSLSLPFSASPSPLRRQSRVLLIRTALRSLASGSSNFLSFLTLSFTILFFSVIFFGGPTSNGRRLTGLEIRILTISCRSESSNKSL